MTGFPPPPHPLLPEGGGPRARACWEPRSGGTAKVSSEKCRLGTKNLGPRFHLPITSKEHFLPRTFRLKTHTESRALKTIPRRASWVLRSLVVTVAGCACVRVCESVHVRVCVHRAGVPGRIQSGKCPGDPTAVNRVRPSAVCASSAGMKGQVTCPAAAGHSVQRRQAVQPRPPC